jgi:hypothetical protein
MSLRRIPQKSKRAFHPAIDDLEGRRLMSTARPMVLEASAPAIAHVDHKIPMARQGQQAGDQLHAQLVHHTSQHASRPKIDHREVRRAPSPVGKVVGQDSPAIAGFNGKLYRATTDEEFSYVEIIRIQSSSNGGATWDDVGKVRAHTNSGAALATFDGRLYLAWTGYESPHLINIESSSNGVDFGNKVTLAEGAYGFPALAASGGRLYVAWTGLDKDHHLNLASSSDGVNWSQRVTLPETSDAGPGLSDTNSGGLEIAWAGRGKNAYINVASSSDGVNFSHAVTLPETTQRETSFGYAVGPALADLGARLYIAWAGTDDRLNTEWSSDGVTFGAKHIYSEIAGEGAGPELASLNGKMYMTWFAYNNKDAEEFHTMSVS